MIQSTDHLLTPQNAALIVIDYQPVQVTSIASMERQRLVSNIVRAAKAAVNVWTADRALHGQCQDRRQQATDCAIAQVLLEKFPVYDRTTINAWEDIEFRQAVEGTGRKKLIMTALWTEACLTFPALDAMKARLRSFVVADAVGGRR